MAIETQQKSTDSYNAYSFPQYSFSSPGSENPNYSEELVLLNPDRETLQRHHDFLVALWEAGVIYIKEIADYQIAMRRESCFLVMPLERSPYQTEARNKARERADQWASDHNAAV